MDGQDVVNPDGKTSTAMEFTAAMQQACKTFVAGALAPSVTSCDGDCMASQSIRERLDTVHTLNTADLAVELASSAAMLGFYATSKKADAMFSMFGFLATDLRP